MTLSLWVPAGVRVPAEPARAALALAPAPAPGSSRANAFCAPANSRANALTGGVGVVVGIEVVM